MRKILCFILAFTMLFTTVAASAAMSSDKIPVFLDKAGIIAEGTFADDTKTVTRGEFAQMISKLIAIDNYKGLSTSQIFKDIPVDHPLYDVTTLLYQMYYIVGDGNGYFEPEAPLTAEAACKILVNLLGDQYFAQYYGGYIPAAASKGVLKGVDVAEGQTITVKSAMKLIYNTMIADISNSNTYYGNAATSNPPAEMFMSKRLGIYITEGTVTDDGVTSLAGDTKIDENQIKIGSDVFENQTGMEELLGYTVEGFYKHDKDADKNILIFAYVNENKTDVLELKDTDIVRYANLTYEYYTDELQNETEEVFLNATYRIIYNGHAFSTETKEASFTKTVDEMLRPENGNVKLIDTDGDGYYDLISVTDYEIVAVDYIDVENYTIYGDADYTNTIIDLSKAKDNLVIKNNSGSEFTIDAINQGSVLSVAKAADGKRARIGYSNTKVTGTLASTDGEYYYVGETQYASTKTFRDYLAANPNAVKIGDNGAFYLTFDGKMAYCVPEAEDAIKVGYFYNVHLKSALDDTLTIRLLTDSSDIADFVAADRVVADGRVYKDKMALAEYLLTYKKQLIRYRVNGDGMINYIDTPYDITTGNPNYLTESEDSLHIMRGANNEEAYYYAKSYSFGDRFVIDGRTKAYIVPRNAGLEEAYVTDYTNSKIKSNGSYTITAYATKTDGLFAEHLVYNVATKHTTPYSQYYPTYGIVTRVKDALNFEGEPIKKVTICDGDQYFTYETESSSTLTCDCGLGVCATNPLEVGVGDVIAYTVTDNVIYDRCAIICYDHSQGKVVNPGSDTFFVETSDSCGIMHSFDAANLTKAVARLTEGTYVMPFYINKVEKNAAEFVFDYWPFYQSATGNSSLKLEDFSVTSVSKIFTIQSAFTIKINAGANTFEPIRVNDLKVYNDGNGVMEKGIMVIYQGLPQMLIYYK